LHCQATVVITMKLEAFASHPTWSKFGGSLTQYMWDSSLKQAHDMVYLLLLI
jgi:hypothetical protein